MPNADGSYNPGETATWTTSVFYTTPQYAYGSAPATQPPAPSAATASSVTATFGNAPSGAAAPVTGSARPSPLSGSGYTVTASVGAWQLTYTYGGNGAAKFDTYAAIVTYSAPLSADLLQHFPTYFTQAGERSLSGSCTVSFQGPADNGSGGWTTTAQTATPNVGGAAVYIGPADQPALQLTLQVTDGTNTGASVTVSEGAQLTLLISAQWEGYVGGNVALARNQNYTVNGVSGGGQYGNWTDSNGNLSGYGGRATADSVQFPFAPTRAQAAGRTSAAQGYPYISSVASDGSSYTIVYAVSADTPGGPNSAYPTMTQTVAIIVTPAITMTGPTLSDAAPCCCDTVTLSASGTFVSSQSAPTGLAEIMGDDGQWHTSTAYAANYPVSIPSSGHWSASALVTMRRVDDPGWSRPGVSGDSYGAPWVVANPGAQDAAQNSLAAGDYVVAYTQVWAGGESWSPYLPDISYPASYSQALSRIPLSEGVHFNLPTAGTVTVTLPAAAAKAAGDPSRPAVSYNVYMAPAQQVRYTSSGGVGDPAGPVVGYQRLGAWRIAASVRAGATPTPCTIGNLPAQSDSLPPAPLRSKACVQTQYRFTVTSADGFTRQATATLTPTGLPTATLTVGHDVEPRPTRLNDGSPPLKGSVGGYQEPYDDFNYSSWASGPGQSANNYNVGDTIPVSWSTSGGTAVYLYEGSAGYVAVAASGSQTVTAANSSTTASASVSYDLLVYGKCGDLLIPSGFVVGPGGSGGAPGGLGAGGLAALARRLGDYSLADALRDAQGHGQGIKFFRCDNGSPASGWTISNVVITSDAGAAHPSLAGRPDLSLLCAFDADGTGSLAAGPYLCVSYDDGSTWSNPTAMGITSGQYPVVRVGKRGDVVFMAYVDDGTGNKTGTLMAMWQSPGDTAPSAPVQVKDGNNTPIPVQQGAFGLDHLAEGPGRWILSILKVGDTAPSQWTSADDAGFTFTRVAGT